MYYTGTLFDWDDANVSHIAENGVTIDEVAEAFNDDLVMTFDAYDVAGEKREAIIAKTLAGRYLKVVYTIRGGLLRVVTAHTAKRKLRGLYDGR